MNDIKQLKDKGLEKVAGGRTYSKSTYFDLGKRPSRRTSQNLYNHPLIVTYFNHCKLSSEY